MLKRFEDMALGQQQHKWLNIPLILFIIIIAMDKQVRSDADSMNLNANKTDFYIDIAFAVIFFLAIVILTITSVKSFKNKLNQNLYSVLTVLFLMLTIVTRFGCLLYSLISNTELSKELELFFFFEVPFDFIMTALIVLFFQFIQITAYLF